MEYDTEEHPNRNTNYFELLMTWCDPLPELVMYDGVDMRESFYLAFMNELISYSILKESDDG